MNSQPTAFVAGAALLPARAAATLGQKVGAGRSGGFAEHCSAPAKPAGCAKPAVEARRRIFQPFGWKAIDRAEMVKASEKHMPSSAPWVFSEGKMASTILTEPQA